MLNSFLSIILQDPKSTGTVVHQQKNSGFDMLCKSHLTLMFIPWELARSPCSFRTRHLIHRLKTGTRKCCVLNYSQTKRHPEHHISKGRIGRTRAGNQAGKHSTPELWHSHLFHRLYLQIHKHATEMQVWLWRIQPAFVLCFKPDQRQTWNPFYVWTAGPKLLKQLAAFRLSSAELWERSPATPGVKQYSWMLKQNRHSSRHPDQGYRHSLSCAPGCTGPRDGLSTAQTAVEWKAWMGQYCTD